MKSKEELNALKEEVEAVSQDLTDEELEQVAGGDCRADENYDIGGNSI